MRPRQSNGELITFRADRPHLGSQFKGQTSETMGTVAMGALPAGAAGEPGSSPGTGWKWLETAPRSPGTLSTVLSCRSPRFFWEWLWMTVGDAPLTGTEEVKFATRRQPQSIRDKQTSETRTWAVKGKHYIQTKTHNLCSVLIQLYHCALWSFLNLLLKKVKILRIELLQRL